VGVVARVDRKDALKFVTKLIALLEDNGLAVFLEPKLAERIKKSRLLYACILLFSRGESF
jgi:hypothetical protein